MVARRHQEIDVQMQCGQPITRGKATRERRSGASRRASTWRNCFAMPGRIALIEGRGYLPRVLGVDAQAVGPPD